MMRFSEVQKKLCSGEASFLELAMESREASLECQKKTNAFLNVFDKHEISKQVNHAKTLHDQGLATALTGVPIAIKENILIKGYRSSAGSKMLENHIAIYDAHVIGKLKKAGAILIGTTNMDEFAMGSTSETSYFGPTKNPLDTGRVPGGSSGGSAAAVAFGAVPLALGTDTGGSVRQPAAFCGVVGYKPSYGKVSRSGIVAFASSLDQVGVFSSDVSGIAATLEVIEGQDVADSTTESFLPTNLSRLVGDFSQLKNYKVGFLNETLSAQLDADVSRAWSFFKDFLSKNEIHSEEFSAPVWDYALEAYYLICCSEASSNLARYDGVRFGHRAKSLDLESMYLDSRSEGFGAEVKQRILLGALALSTGYFDAYFKKAALVRRQLTHELSHAFTKCDFIVMPTSPTVAFELGSKTSGTLEMYQNDIFTVAVNLAGLAAVSIPIKTSGMSFPAGIQIIARRGADQQLLEFASLVERVF